MALGVEGWPEGVWAGLPILPSLCKFGFVLRKQFLSSGWAGRDIGAAG